MTGEPILSSPASLPSIFMVRPEARTRMRDFFISHIRNANTRRAYRDAVPQFSVFSGEHDIVDLAQAEPVHVAALVELQLETQSKPTVKLRLAALRMLFDWMVVGQVIPTNPAHAVRGPKHSQRRGKTPALQADEARTLIDSIHVSSFTGLRDRALIGFMISIFARVAATTSMKVKDFFVQGRRGWVRLHENGGKEHEMSTHHNLNRTLRNTSASPILQKSEKGALSYYAGPVWNSNWKPNAAVRRMADDSQASARRRD